MNSIFRTLFCIFGLFGFSIALPILETTGHAVSSSSQECPTGTFFTRCATNGFSGCCSVDPCNLSGCPDIPNKLPAFRIGSPECSPGTHTLYQPNISSISSTNPESTYTGTGISVYQRGTDTKQQITVFTGISNKAKSCQLRWSAPHGSNFTVIGSGYVAVSILKNPLPSYISWNSVQKIEGNRIGAADFNAWPHDLSPATNHDVGLFDCGSEVAFRVGMNDASQGSVDLAQDSNTGWFVQYDC